MIKVKFDEIGNQIIDSELTEALHATAFQVVRQWQILTKDKNLNTTEFSLVGTNNQFVKADKNQVMLTTKKNLTLEKVLDDLTLQAEAVRKKLGHELVLWPFSEKLHASLANKVGSQIRLTLPEKLFSELYAAKFSKSEVPYVDFRNQVYFKLLREFSLHQAFLVYLFGATPYAWVVQTNETNASPKRSMVAASLQEATGTIDYSSLENYLNSLKAKDLPLKLAGNYRDPLEMKASGVHYLELNLIDLDPFHAQGVTAHQLRLLEVMSGYFLMNEEKATTESLAEANELAKAVANENPFAKTKIFAKAYAFLKELDRFAKKFNYPKWQGTFDVLKKRLEKSEETPTTRLLRTQGKHETLADYGMFLAQKYQESALIKEVTLDKNTQLILDEAVVAGIDYHTVLPQAGILQLNGKLLKQGIQTTKDSAVMSELWQHKQTAKEFLGSQNVNVSRGFVVTSRQEAKAIYPLLKDKAVVIKNAVAPSDKTTRLFRMPPTEHELLAVVEQQLKQTAAVLIEQVVVGSVYRALVVNDEIISLVERIPANVVGDGRLTLKDLISRKNARARAEFEMIELGEVEKATLKSQGLTLESVIPRGIQVLLRYDATYNTGSQAYEVLDEIDQSYLTELKRQMDLLQLHDGSLDVVIPNIYQPYSEPTHLTFLNAHAYPALALNEFVLLKQEKQPIAQKVLAQFK